ncbi:MAG: hypothetical protein ABL857_07545 [Rickettsiales bacterium]|jgi:hypothetical protein
MTMQPSEESSGKFLVTAALVVIIAAVGYYVLSTPDQRSAGQKIGDAIDELPNGVDKAARQLEDKTIGERLGDAVKDAGDDLKENTNQQ